MTARAPTVWSDFNSREDRAHGVVLEAGGGKHGRKYRGQMPVFWQRGAGCRRRQPEPHLVAEPAARRPAEPALVQVRSAGPDLQLPRGVQEARLCGAEERPAQADDGVAGLVAGRLRPLRSADDPHGLAQRRHLPHRRRPRRRRPWPAAFRPAQQLARQRQHRQVAPPAVADQAEVRAGHFLGRSHDPHRQCRARDHGLPHFRFRCRSRRHLGAGSGRLLGPGDHLARADRRIPTAAIPASAISRTRSRPSRWA